MLLFDIKYLNNFQGVGTVCNFIMNIILTATNFVGTVIAVSIAVTLKIYVHAGTIITSELIFLTTLWNRKKQITIIIYYLLHISAAKQ